MFDMETVESSNVAAIGYHGESETLQIEFNNGSVYQYFDVPQHTFDGLKDAASKGKYLNAHVKGYYRYSRV